MQEDDIIYVSPSPLKADSEERRCVCSYNLSSVALHLSSLVRSPGNRTRIVQPLRNQPLARTEPLKISIVTLSFNQRAYLQEAIDSVLSQGYLDLEYIVVDPGSTDGSRDLIKSYGDRIAHCIFEPDRGAADGLNKGFERATGDVFGFLNADDLLFPGALRRWQSFSLPTQNATW